MELFVQSTTTYNLTTDYFFYYGMVVCGLAYSLTFFLLTLPFPRLRIRPMALYIIHYVYVLIVSILILIYIIQPFADSFDYSSFWSLRGNGIYIYIISSYIITSLTFYFLYNKFLKDKTKIERIRNA